MWLIFSGRQFSTKYVIELYCMPISLEKHQKLYGRMVLLSESTQNLPCEFKVRCLTEKMAAAWRYDIYRGEGLSCIFIVKE